MPPCMCTHALTWSLSAWQGVSFTMQRCAATLLLCTGPTVHQCAVCGRSFAFPDASLARTVPASCYFCGVHLQSRDALGRQT